MLAMAVNAMAVDPSFGPASGMPPNLRTDASGDKIPSNAHSTDFPGLYFYWNDKQKDPSVLEVQDWVFDLFEGGSFILTAKNTRAYQELVWRVVNLLYPACLK